MEKLNTFIIPVIRPDLIERCLETLYANTPPNFYVFIIDQTAKGLDINLRERYQDLMIIRPPKTEVHTTGNLGFAKATNTGIALVQTPYFTMCNDDVEFINERWWQGVLDTFVTVAKQTPDRPAVIVNPSSAKLPDWSIGNPAGDHHHIIPYKEEYTDADYDFLVNEPHEINERLTIEPGSVIDGVTLYCSVADTRRFLDIGLLDEEYYPGGAEDYDYSCRASLRGYRSVGTTLAYVWHHWSKTLSTLDAEDVKGLVQDELRFGDQEGKWGPRFDIWGVKCDFTGCEERMRTLDNQIAFCPDHPDREFKIPESVIQAL